MPTIRTSLTLLTLGSTEAEITTMVYLQVSSTSIGTQVVLTVTLASALLSQTKVKKCKLHFKIYSRIYKNDYFRNLIPIYLIDKNINKIF